MNLRAAFLVLAVAVAAWVAGCSKSQPEKQPPSGGEPAPSAGTQTTPGQARAHTEADEAHEHGGAGEAVVPGGTGSEIWTQIAAEQQKLETTIQSGQLSDVHHLAFGIRDLVVALAGKTTPPPENSTKLKQLVEEVRQSAAKLDEYGDSGNLSGVKQEYARFQQELAQLKTLMAG